MARELFNLDGKRALVTGGGRGIGLALAQGLADYGADIVITARTKEQLEKAKQQIESSTGRKVWTFAYDVSQLEGIPDFFQQVVKETGGIDILVNNAGTASRYPSEDYPFEEWRKILTVNLDAVFLMSQAFCRHRKEIGGGGRIINIGSLMCKAARVMNPPYAASKGGILLLTKELAVDWVKYNINVNAIAPGFITTEMTQPLRENEKLNTWVISRTPKGRWGKPEELVGAAVYLASEASSFVTGEIIYVDGGWYAAM
ncbi:MAG: Gluconate 5-dehydrogenase [Planctomycetes bacterium ADurb.Bin412]|nr:MAG: Gluconate 5-dehydrogenase [Planctomycetes bacterium ADurb.Bin412]